MDRFYLNSVFRIRILSLIVIVMFIITGYLPVEETLKAIIAFDLAILGGIIGVVLYYYTRQVRDIRNDTKEIAIKHRDMAEKWSEASFLNEQLRDEVIVLSGEMKQAVKLISKMINKDDMKNKVINSALEASKNG